MDIEALSHIGMSASVLLLLVALLLHVRRYRRQQVSPTETRVVAVFLAAALLFLLFMVLARWVPGEPPLMEVLFGSYVVAVALWICWLLMEWGVVVLQSFSEAGWKRGLLQSASFVLVVLILTSFILSTVRFVQEHPLSMRPWSLWLQTVTVSLGIVAAAVVTRYCHAKSRGDD